MKHGDTIDSLAHLFQHRDLGRLDMKMRPDWALTTAAISCLALMCARAVSVLRSGPYILTSGFEEESLFAIWKSINHQAVYANAYQPPFAQSYFNWMFYQVYGAFGSAASSLAKLDGSALPLVTRCLTLLFSVVTMLIVYQLVSPLSLIRRISGSAVIAFNPLIGFWALTARPDMGALTCDLLGMWCIGKSKKSPSSFWLLIAFLAFYCSWSFKQTYMAAFLAVTLHFLLVREWKRAVLFGGGMLLAIGFTLAVGTPEYRYSAIWSQSHMALVLSLAEYNFGRSILKAPMFLLGLISVVLCIRRDRANVLALWAIISIPLMSFASAKVGASDNYFFEPAAVCSILFLLDAKHLTAASVAQIAAPLLIAMGLVGAPFKEPEPELALLKPHLKGMNGSVFVTEPWANLPWFQVRSPHFVLATTYFADKALGKNFEYGGVGGMVRTGQIDFFVCPREEVNQPFDGIVPASLQKIGADSYWAYFATRSSQTVKASGAVH